MYKLESLLVHESKKILISIVLTYLCILLSHIKIPGIKGVTVIDEE